MKYSGIENKDNGKSGLDELDKAVMEDRADYDSKQRQRPKRNKIAVSQRYDTAHDDALNVNDSVFRYVGTGLESVRKPGDHIKKAVYRKRHEHPELKIRI